MNSSRNELASSASGIWSTIHETLFTGDQLEDLSTFKSGPLNFRIALWDPKSRGPLYLKTLLHELCGSLSKANWQALNKVKNRDFGNPITVKYQGQEACLDYIQAVLELEFIAQHVNLKGLDILEIGSGYGRTSHTVLSNVSVGSYTIVDLDQCLGLTRKYLGQVLDEESLDKVRFIPASEFDGLQDSKFDLCLNIDSFAEMDAPVVLQYLDYIDRQCHYFYVKNPVGKYLPELASANQVSPASVEKALKTGLLRDVVDRFDSDAIVDQSLKFVDVYKPSDNWECIDSQQARPWSWYWQALFANSVGKK